MPTGNREAAPYAPPSWYRWLPCVLHKSPFFVKRVIMRALNLSNRDATVKLLESDSHRTALPEFLLSRCREGWKYESLEIASVV